MKYWIIFSALIYAAVTSGATLTERLAELNNDDDVLEAIIVSDAAPISGFNALYTADIRYAAIDGDKATDNRVRLVGIDHGGAGEAWYWLSVPSELTNDPVKLLTSRTTAGWGALTLAAQEAAVESFCNSVYAAANTGAQNIREFSVSAVKGDTVKVSGYFDIGTTWEQQTWYIRLVDPNGSVAAPYSNIQFERVMTEATAQ